MKATHAVVNGVEHMLWKDPKTDSGEKKSARGRIVITMGADGKMVMTDGLTRAQAEEYGPKNLLQPVWRDGKFLKRHTLAEIRARVAAAT